MLLALRTILRIDRLRRRVFPPDFRPLRFIIVHTAGLFVALVFYPTESNIFIGLLHGWASSILVTMTLYALIGTLSRSGPVASSSSGD